MFLYKQGARKVILKACHLGKPMGGSRGRVQGKRTPPPRDDLRFSNTTGILPKKKLWFIGVGKRRVHPLLKKFLDPPLKPKLA